MMGIRRWFRFGRALGKRSQDKEIPQGTFVMDVQWDRTEELRIDRLGPDWKDVQDPERPSRTLGRLPRL